MSSKVIKYLIINIEISHQNKAYCSTLSSNPTNWPNNPLQADDGTSQLQHIQAQDPLLRE